MLLWQLPALGRTLAINIGKHYQSAASLNVSRREVDARLALKIFQSVLEKDPLQLSALNGLAQMSFITGDLKTTKKVLGEAPMAGTRRGLLSWQGVAKLALDQGNIDLALECWEQGGVLFQPGSLAVVTRIANTFWDNGNPELAQRLYLVALGLQGKRAEDYRSLGNVFETRSGDYLSASRMFEKVVQLEPNSAVDWQHLARLYEKTGQWDEALEAAATALSLQPNFDTAMYEIGLVLSVQGRQDEAVSKLENYLKIYPHSPAVLTLLGSFYLQEGQSSRAEDSLNKALQFVSKGSMLEAWIQSLLGKVALQNGDYPLAAQWVERAVEVTPENVSYLIQLGDLYTLMHQTNKARGIYQQAMNMSPTSAQIAHIQQQLNKLNSP